MIMVALALLSLQMPWKVDETLQAMRGAYSGLAAISGVLEETIETDAGTSSAQWSFAARRPGTAVVTFVDEGKPVRRAYVHGDEYVLLQVEKGVALTGKGGPQVAASQAPGLNFFFFPERIGRRPGQLYENVAVRWAGEEVTPAGRAAVLAWDVSHLAPSASAEPGEPVIVERRVQVRLFVSTDTGLVLGQWTRTDPGDGSPPSVRAWRVTDLRLDGQVDETAFAFKIPAGYRVQPGAR
ncbi:MAG: hypothetical protein IH851_01270 [Armatimonadetes bacterium]|nr:hypothetical protein [Armatimonadota bacterium]